MCKLEFIPVWIFQRKREWNACIGRMNKGHDIVKNARNERLAGGEVSLTLKRDGRFGK